MFSPQLNNNPMNKLLFYGLMYCLFIGCKSDEKCGEIYDKVSRDGRYFFILDPNYSIDVSTPNDNASFIPDNRVSGEVNEAVYNQFEIGQEYCQ